MTTPYAATMEEAEQGMPAGDTLRRPAEDITMRRPPLRPQPNDDILDVMYQVRGMTAHTAEMMRTRQASIAPPTFDGSTDVEDFLELFERIAQHNGWTPDEMAIRLKLAVQRPSGVSLQGGTYDEMRDKLTANHSLSMENAMALLKTLRLRPGDNVFPFSDKLCKLVRRAFPEMDQYDVRRHAMRELVAMLPANSQIAWLFKAQPPQSLEEAVRRIHESNTGTERKVNQFDVDETPKLHDTMMAMMQGTQSSMQSLVQQIAEGQKQIAEGQKQIMQVLAQQRQQRRPANRSETDTRKCYSCQQTGHIARNCPNKASQKMSGEENSKVQGT